MTLIELINEGNYGLIKAAKKFDPSKNVKFISYAVWWIRQTMMKAILENNSNVRIPLSQISKINMVEKAQQEIIDNERKIPTIKEIAEKLSIDEKEVKSIIDLNKSEVSLSDPISDDESLYLSDTIEQDSFVAPEEVLLRKRYKETLNSQLDKLSEREANVLRKYFGLDDFRPHTLEEIGEELSISRERVRQIKDRAVGKLREMTKGTLEIYNE